MKRKGMTFLLRLVSGRIPKLLPLIHLHLSNIIPKAYSNNVLKLL